MSTATRKIEVLDYDPHWQDLFSQEKYMLSKVLKDNLVAIEHIGSTSVKGLAAKPIIDILIEVNTLTHLDNQQGEIEALGYVARGENTIKGRRYYQKGGVQRSHHIHAFETANPHLTEHRAFRDYLSTHRDIAQAYANIKRQAAARCCHNSEEYMRLKNDFVEKQMALALAWYHANQA